MAEPGKARSKDPATPELSSLAVTAMAALYEAGLYDEMEQLRARVLSRGASLFDQVSGDNNDWRVTYKPMAELLLLHVREAAVAPRHVDERRREIRWALDIAGF